MRGHFTYPTLKNWSHTIRCSLVSSPRHAQFLIDKRNYEIISCNQSVDPTYRWLLQLNIEERDIKWLIHFNGISTCLGIILYLVVRESRSLYFHIPTFCVVVSENFFFCLRSDWIRTILNYIHIYMCIFMCMCVQAHVCVCISLCVYMPLCVCVCACGCVCVRR